MKNVKRIQGVSLVAGLLLSLGAGSHAETFDRLVGAVAPTGGAYLIKHFHVTKGSVVIGVEFFSSDFGATFPKVLLLRGPATSIVGATVLAELRNVRAPQKHRTTLAFPAVSLDAEVDLYVAIGLPASDGVRGVGQGAGIGARTLAGAPTSYFAGDRDARFGVMDVDYGIELLFQQIGKASRPEPAQQSVPVFLKVTSPVLESSLVEFGVEQGAQVTLTIYDVVGRRVRTLVQGNFAPGRYSYAWDGRDEGGVASATGIYFAKLSVGEKVLTEKLLLGR